jgi:hypothetical protein
MSNLGEIFPTEYLAPVAGMGMVPLGVCEDQGPGTSGGYCNSGTTTGSGGCNNVGSGTGKGGCNAGCTTEGNVCTSDGAHTSNGGCNPSGCCTGPMGGCNSGYSQGEL